MKSVTINTGSRGNATAIRFVLVVTLIGLCGIIGDGPAWAQPYEGCDKDPGTQTADRRQPPNLDHIKRQLLHYRCTKYDSDVAAVVTKARHWVQRRASQVHRPAIILDIDETSLSNWERIIKDDFAYIAGGPCNLKKTDESCGDIAWQQSGKAPAIAPTLDLYRLARCIDIPRPSSCTKVEIFFVTGRHEKESNGKLASAWTLRNLATAGYKDVARDHLYMRDPNSRGLVSVHKTAARIAIEQKGYTIIANIGDQESDLVGRHAERTFKVPNPFYFIP
jgi:acid phosphatase